MSSNVRSRMITSGILSRTSCRASPIFPVPLTSYPSFSRRTFKRFRIGSPSSTTRMFCLPIGGTSSYRGIICRVLQRLLRGSVLISPKCATRPQGGVLIILHHLDAVHEYVRKAGGILVRGFEGCIVLHFRGIKDDQVSPASFANEAAVLEPKRGRGKRRHSTNRILKSQNAQLTNITSKDARVVSVTARVRHTFVEAPHTAVRRKHRVWVSHEILHIGFVHVVENAAGAAVLLNLQNSF